MIEYRDEALAILNDFNNDKVKKALEEMVVIPPTGNINS
jgi:hypothetical protein